MARGTTRTRRFRTPRGRSLEGPRTYPNRTHTRWCEIVDRRLIVPAESPGASRPSSAASASENPPVEILFRYSHGNNSSIVFVRRGYGGRIEELKRNRRILSKPRRLRNHPLRRRNHPPSNRLRPTRRHHRSNQAPGRGSPKRIKDAGKARVGAKRPRFERESPGNAAVANRKGRVA